MSHLIRCVSIFLLVMSLSIETLLAQEATEEAAGNVRTDAQGIEQVWVPAGCFMMGTSETEAKYALSLNPPAWDGVNCPASSHSTKFVCRRVIGLTATK